MLPSSFPRSAWECLPPRSASRKRQGLLDVRVY